MSSKYKKHQYPTGWTKWEWSEQYQRNFRARERSKGDWEYEYAQPQAGDEQIPRELGDLPASINDQNQQYDEQPSDNYRHDSAVNELTQTLSDAKLDDPRDRGKGRSQSRGSEDRRGSNASYGGQSYSQSPPIHSGQVYQQNYSGSYADSTPIHPGYDSQGQQNRSVEHQRDALPPLYEDQGSTSSQQPEVAYGSFSATGMTYYQSQSSSSRPQRKVFTKDPNRTKDKLDPSISPADIPFIIADMQKGFKSTNQRSFTSEGQVFKVLWSEPVGSGGTEITQQPAKYGEKSFHKVRRFVIMRKSHGHSTCIPILTYGYKGLLKPGVHPEDHTVVYSSKTEGPYYLPGERELVSKAPIRFDMKDPSEKLDPLSRMNYAKTYTVEHNVKVYFIGWIGRNYEQEVATCFNQANPPVVPSSGGRGSDRPDEALFSYTQGDDPSYPGAITIPQGASSGYVQPHTSSYTASSSYIPTASQSYSVSYSSNAQFTPSEQQGPSAGEAYEDPTHRDDIYSP